MEDLSELGKLNIRQVYSGADMVAENYTDGEESDE